MNNDNSISPSNLSVSDKLFHDLFVQPHAFSMTAKVYTLLKQRPHTDSELRQLTATTNLHSTIASLNQRLKPHSLEIIRYPEPIRQGKRKPATWRLERVGE